MKAAVYLRVSTTRQDEANQEPECLRICTARGWEPVLFREQESAVKRRPVWEQVKAAVHRGEVSRVVVWALDRAGRDRVQLAQDWRDMLSKGARLVSVREPWTEQEGPLHALLVEVVAYFAEAERVRLIERTKAGQAAARARGVRIGRPPANPDDVRRMEKAWREGKSAFIAARDLDLPEGTVRNYFRRWDGHRFNPRFGQPRKVSPENGGEGG